MNKRQEIMEAIPHAPALPLSVQELMAVLEQPDYSIEHAIEKIEYDPVLTMSLLRLVNSALFAPKDQIGSVREAVVRLGKRRLLALAVAQGLASVAGNALPGYNLEGCALIRHQIATAVLADEFTRRLRISAPDYLLTAALLHDIGKTVFSSFVAEEIEVVKRLAFQDGKPFFRAEQEALGMDHGEAGALLLSAWNLPEPLPTVVRWHHEPYECPEQMLVLDLVHVADFLALESGIGAGVDGMNYTVSEGSVARLGLRAQDVEQVLGGALARIEDTTASILEGIESGAASAREKVQ